ncbi:NAD-dependent epimerase/dehydratase family protein [Mucilaginibacter ginsenosidivorans]|uniref:NAD-dependent epimerase/dehydratase family protein n=1 Tax=Mucilaginibacter ginsenosidivorans TaxID=398053 RepID=A0A5B8V2X4_9SPHI|nr:NAD-dependent epimerase/dehydratase family protein [Mucilaginibacter ginsenosidivorans]QEC65041.1 NAD-dependent epimerase/dehydratase family protein [Mucilaginibacter ginsenosidivorans]
MHTILGAGGPVANALTRELANNKETIRLVSRKPVESKEKNISWKKADLLNYNEILEASKGSDVIYLTAGLVYDIKVWRAQWPVIMQNFINLGKETGARLIFFDNVYSYGLVNGPMLETTPYNPCSQKGEVRAKIATQLMDETRAGNINATIARGADFYGTESMNSFFDMMVLDKYAKKQSAQWIGNPGKLHNFSYIPDMGRGMYLLGQNADTDNQIWHMPTAAPLTGKQFIELAAKIYGVKAKFMSINKLMMQLYGLFDKNVKSAVEMNYQYENDYIFNSDKFEKAFSYHPETYENGIKLMSETFYQQK